MDKKIYINTIILITITSFSFYWFQLRPSNIRKNCAQESTESAVLSTQNYEQIDTLKRQEKQSQLTDTFYKQCIKGQGLDK